MDAAFDSTPAMSETFAQPQTLLLLTNQELWPGIICSRHFRPEKVILLYGNTPAASKEAALRLQKFLLKSGLVEKCDLLELPDDDFVGIQQRLGSPSSGEIRRKPDRAYPAPRSPMAGYSEPSQRNPERSLKWGDGFSRYHLRKIVAAHSLTAPQILVTFPKLGRVYGRDWYQLSAEGILQRGEPDDEHQRGGAGEVPVEGGEGRVHLSGPLDTKDPGNRNQQSAPCQSPPKRLHD